MKISIFFFSLFLAFTAAMQTGTAAPLEYPEQKAGSGGISDGDKAKQLIKDKKWDEAQQLIEKGDMPERKRDELKLFLTEQKKRSK